MGLLVALSTAASAETFLKGSHSVVYGSLENPEELAFFAKTADEMIDQTRGFLAQLGLSAEAEETLQLKVYRTHPEMLQKMPRSAAKDVSTLGYFNHHSHEVGFFYSGNAEEMARIIRHETVHFVLHQALNKVPAAVDEALAEFLSRDPQALASGRAQSLPMVLRNVLDGAVASQTLPILEQLFALNNSNFYGPNQDIHYAATYAVSAYLLNTQGPRVLGNFITAISGGANAARWIAQKTGTTAADFQKAAIDWAVKG